MADDTYSISSISPPILDTSTCSLNYGNYDLPPLCMIPSWSFHSGVSFHIKINPNNSHLKVYKKMDESGLIVGVGLLFYINTFKFTTFADQAYWLMTNETKLNTKRHITILFKKFPDIEDIDTFEAIRDVYVLDANNLSMLDIYRFDLLKMFVEGECNGFTRGIREAYPLFTSTVDLSDVHISF